MIDLYVLHNDKKQNCQRQINLDKLANKEIYERQEILELLHSTMTSFSIAQKKSYDYLY